MAGTFSKEHKRGIVLPVELRIHKVDNTEGRKWAEAEDPAVIGNRRVQLRSAILNTKKYSAFSTNLRTFLYSNIEQNVSMYLKNSYNMSF